MVARLKSRGGGGLDYRVSGECEAMSGEGIARLRGKDQSRCQEQSVFQHLQGRVNHVPSSAARVV
jgi:hypothetical protein